MGNPFLPIVLAKIRVGATGGIAPNGVTDRFADWGSVDVPRSSYRWPYRPSVGLPERATLGMNQTAIRPAEGYY